MPNLVNENRVIRFLDRFSPSMNFLFFLLILLGTLLFWVLFFYFPMDLDLKKEKFLYNNYLVRKSVYQKTLSNFQNFQDENKKLSIKLKKIYEKELASQELLDNILSVLKKNELSCSELIPQEHKPSSLFNKEIYFLRAKGKFLNMLSFISDISDFGNCIKIKELEFLKKKNGKVLLNAKIQLAMFNA